MIKIFYGPNTPDIPDTSGLDALLRIKQMQEQATDSAEGDKTAKMQAKLQVLKAFEEMNNKADERERQQYEAQQQKMQAQEKQENEARDAIMISLHNGILDSLSDEQKIILTTNLAQVQLNGARMPANLIKNLISSKQYEVLGQLLTLRSQQQAVMSSMEKEIYTLLMLKN